MLPVVTGVFGLPNGLEARAVNFLILLALSSVSESFKFEKLKGSNTDVSGSCCGKLVLGVPVIAGGCLGVTYLLKGYAGLVQ